MVPAVSDDVKSVEPSFLHTFFLGIAAWSFQCYNSVFCSDTIATVNPIKFIHQVREELAKVSWPNRKDTLNMTVIVLGVSVAVGLYVGGLDAVFTSLFDIIIRR